ncbi:MAG: UPF0104 family protein [Chlorobiaceae bacterium]|nr:UPF0104 family protein [Chlorobiaceae bacterium]
MNPGKKAGRNWPGYAGLAVGFMLIGYLLSTMDLAGAFQRINAIGFASILILLPYLGLHLLETFAWRKLFPPSVGRVDLLKLFKIQVVAETVSMTLPAGVAVGEPLRPWLCRRFMGVPLPDGFASITVRKLMLGAAQGLYTIIGAIAGFSILQAASNKVLGFGGLGIAMLAIGAVITFAFLSMLLMMFNGNAVGALHRLLVKVPFRKVREWLVEREEGFAETDRKLLGVKADGLAGLVPVMLMYIGAWLMLSVESYLILNLLGIKLAFGQVLAFDTAMLMLRAIFFFIPSGLGVQELGYLAFFGALGVSAADLAAFLLLRRAKEILWYAIGYIVMFLEGIRLDDARTAEGEVG